MVINAEIDRNQEEHEQATRKSVRWSDHHTEISPQSLGMVFGTYSTSTPNEDTEIEIRHPQDQVISLRSTIRLPLNMKQETATPTLRTTS